MKTLKVCLTAAAVSSALLASSAMAVEADFNGYMRAGTGVSTHSGANESYEKNKVGRLGNENDVYGEIGLNTKPIKAGETAEFTVNSMLAYGSDGSNGWESARDDDDGADVALVQFNVQAKGLFDFDPDAVLWAGKRYYQRQDIHITDFYYWNTNGGAGGGLEHLSVGPGKLSVAFIRDDSLGNDLGVDLDGDGQNDNQNININNFDVRYADLGLWKDASLELGINYYMVNETDEQEDLNLDTKDSVMATAVITQGNFFGGFNKTVFQFGTNGAASAMAGLGSGSWIPAVSDGDTGFRVINFGVINMGDSWNLGHQVMYAQSSYDNSNKDDHTFANVVVRPIYNWSEIMKTEFEAGYFTEENQWGTKGADNEGAKFTVAQAWAAGAGFWARPEIRVYASYVDDFKNDNRFGNDESSEMSFGIQAEAWW
ncbi:MULTISPECIES: maltoporin LamB [Vibrio]|uniref:Maltoporin LamB n=1 Tax=Vibrio casei TaxID=673372 RepID=A0A368LIN6_9VIBR|nr:MULTISPECIES: maltoporin LamB [Vibrio]RCS70485.1 maltoporin LamB [Vibrio casei]SJN28078.1 Maltoporin (maltose/maltodextrin high-affinity receptor, phage lambda receptor protein) [Vibrio casei]HBV77924.1 maltoporin LamB [Vibrio sp.]